MKQKQTMFILFSVLSDVISGAGRACSDSDVINIRLSTVIGQVEKDVDL